MMKTGGKVVENYEIMQTLSDDENDQILLAKHIQTHEYHTLKKLSIKNQQNQELHESLLSQARILKRLDHQNIIKYQKMIKTPNTIYFVYDYLEGDILADLIDEGPQSLTFNQKLSIAKQLSLVLSQLKNKGVAHLSLDPECIILSEDNVIQVTQFIYATLIPEEGQIEMSSKVPKTPFVSPQLRKGLACYQADIFSVGKILQKLDFQQWHQSQQVQPAKQRIQEILIMINGMTQKQLYSRLTTTQIYQVLSKQKKKVKRMKSIQSSQEVKSSKLIRMSSSVTSGKGFSNINYVYTEIIYKILKFRNLCWFLIKLFKLITVDIRLCTELQTVVAMMILKKSTLTLVNIGKYLTYGQNMLNIDIKPKDQQKFFKCGDYQKMRDLIDKQIKIQKKEWEGAIEAIYIHHSSLLKIPQFAKELKEDKFDNKYFISSIRQYINVLIGKQDLMKQFTHQKLKGIYLLSFIVYFKGIEQFFKIKIIQQPVQLQEQIFMKKVASLKEQDYLKLIATNLKSETLEI